MIVISIDGACRRNGKPDCVSAGGVVVRHYDDTKHSILLSAHEYESTNQRGELLALLKALDYVGTVDDEDIYIITDSEYIYNAMTKKWYEGWMRKGWLTASGEPVKNKEIWMQISMSIQRCHEPMFYHIKGHCIPFGRVTADNLLTADPSGTALFTAIEHKYEASKASKAPVFEAAQKLSERNNGFRLDEDKFKLFVVMNTMADAVATKVVDAADNIPWS